MLTYFTMFVSVCGLRSGVGDEPGDGRGCSRLDLGELSLLLRRPTVGVALGTVCVLRWRRGWRWRRSALELLPE